MNSVLWFYSDTQQTYGPIAAPQLIAMIQAGQLVAGHFIMPQGAQEWQYVSASPFAGYLPQAAPPPSPRPEPALPPPPQSPQRVPGQPYRPVQQRAAVSPPQALNVKKSRGGLIATTVVLLLAAIGGTYFWFKPSTTAGDFPSATKEKPFINSLGMKFVPVPGTDLLMCMHETRKRDFSAFAEDDPRVHDMWKASKSGDRAVSSGNDHPVVCMSWYDADAFCDWLSKKEGLVYRLPTDHEWCLAAGIPSNPNAQEARDANLFPTEISSEHDTTHPVMALRPNKFGLYDLTGNVIEWCSDFSPRQNQYFVIHGGMWSPFNDGGMSYSGKSTKINDRVIRGGMCASPQEAGFRQGGDGPTQHRTFTGFRCALAPVPLPVPEWTPIKRVDGCVSYNPAKLKIVDRGADGWLLTDGTIHLQLLDNEADANLALAMAKEHTQRCIIGRGDSYSTFEYWTGDSGLKGGAKSSNISAFDASKFYIEKGKEPKFTGWALMIKGDKRDNGIQWFASELQAKSALDFARQHPRRSILGEGNKRGRSDNGSTYADLVHFMIYWE